MGELRFVRSPIVGHCRFCGKDTRGKVIPKNVTMDLAVDRSIFVCPGCRDTKVVQKKLGEIFGIEVERIITEEGNGAIPQEEQMRPMKGKHIDDVGFDFILQRASRWVAEKKYDGARCLAYFRKDGISYLSSRHSKRTGEYVDHAKHLPHLQAVMPELEGTVVDGELIAPVHEATYDGVRMVGTLPITLAMLNASPEKSVRMQQALGKMRYVVFDCLKLMGKDLRELPFYQRRQFLCQVLGMVRWPLPYEGSICYAFKSADELRTLFENAVHMGFEGLMLKDLDATYYAPSVGARSKGLIKWKKTVTYDGFITGFILGERGDAGLVGALLISGYDESGKVREFAAVGNIERIRQIEMTEVGPDGQPRLKQEYYGKVIEVRGQELTKNMRIRHANLMRWRPDKSPDECEAPVEARA
jgi:ATP-dependent DNA ligase